MQRRNGIVQFVVKIRFWLNALSLSMSLFSKCFLFLPVPFLTLPLIFPFSRFTCMSHLYHVCSFYVLSLYVLFCISFALFSSPNMWPNIRKRGLWWQKRKLSYGSTFVAQNSFLYVCPLLSYKGKRAQRHNSIDSKKNAILVFQCFRSHPCHNFETTPTTCYHTPLM